MDDVKPLPNTHVPSAEARRWRDDNREAIEAWNKWDKENALITDEDGPLA